MELRDYLRIARKWGWLVILLALAGGLIAFAVRRSQPAVYQASTKIMVGNYYQVSNPATGAIQTGEALATTYAELLRTRPVLQGTIDALGLDMSTNTLAGSIETAIIPKTSLLVLSVKDKDPEQAAAITNELANQLILNSPTNLSPDVQQSYDNAKSQILVLQNQIKQSSTELERIRAQVNDASNETDVLRLRAEYDLTQNQIDQYRTALADYERTVAALQQRTNSLTVVEPAIVPADPESNGVVQAAIIGALIGLIASGALVVFLSHRNDTIESAVQAGSVLDLPVLATVTSFGKSKDSYSQRLVTQHSPTSPVAETYRSLQTHLLFLARHNGQPRKGVYLITSPGPGEGKSVTAANLAVAMASTGAEVLLIDADLRQPSIHELLDVPNKGNLSRLLLTSPKDLSFPRETTNGWSEMSDLLSESVQATTVPNLRVITSGPLPPVPAEVLNSEYIPEWIEIFREYLNVDVILFDTPPCLLVADSSILAGVLRPEVLLVIEAGKTERDAARRAKEQFNYIGNPITGLVLNKANPRDQKFGYGYGYYQLKASEPTPEIEATVSNEF